MTVKGDNDVVCEQGAYIPQKSDTTHLHWWLYIVKAKQRELSKSGQDCVRFGSGQLTTTHSIGAPLDLYRMEDMIPAMRI